jgi:hypothetical protein
VPGAADGGSSAAAGEASVKTGIVAGVSVAAIVIASIICVALCMKCGKKKARDPDLVEEFSHPVGEFESEADPGFALTQTSPLYPQTMLLPFGDMAE